MTIQNQCFTNTVGLDLKALITSYGPPHYPSKRNPVGQLNEDFWAHLFAIFNEVIYENRETEFYTYLESIGIYARYSQYLLLQQISNDILAAANNWSGYEPLEQLRNARHLSGVGSHL